MAMCSCLRHQKTSKQTRNHEDVRGARDGVGPGAGGSSGYVSAFAAAG